MKSNIISGKLGSLIVLAFFLSFVSCSDKDDAEKIGDMNVLNQEDPEINIVEETDFSEKDEDLLTVDYKEFYDQLSPHGEWLEVPIGELGMNPDLTAEEYKTQSAGITLSDLFGIKSAVAKSSSSLSMAFVWKPSDNLAIAGSIVEGEPVHYVPYTNGRWIYTNDGWYFKAPTPHEEIVHHYGRWAKSPTYGWVWIPGRVWAPAWVVWKENPKYVAWAPAPPSSYLIGTSISVPFIDVNLYYVVEKKYFVQPQIYKYMYKENKNKIMIKEMTKVDGVMIKNHKIINKGPAITSIEKFTGKTINPVTINRVRLINEVKYSNNSFFVYAPEFKRVTNPGKGKTFSSKPKSYVKFEEWSKRESSGRETKNNRQDLDKKSRTGSESDKSYEKKSPGVKKKNFSDDSKKTRDNVRKNSGDGKSRNYDNKEVRNKNSQNEKMNDKSKGRENQNVKGNKNRKQQ